MNITFRAAEPSDEPFLRDLFAMTRTEALQLDTWPPLERQTIIDLQYRAQGMSYQSMYPDAEQRIILLDRNPAGQMIVWEGATEIRFVDIAVHPLYRRRGLAKAAVQEVLNESLQKQLPIRLQILRSNHASLALAESMGFVIDDESDAQWSLVYDPKTA